VKREDFFDIMEDHFGLAKSALTYVAEDFFMLRDSQ
jgi:hypothetical protein